MVLGLEDEGVGGGRCARKRRAHVEVTLQIPYIRGVTFDGGSLAGHEEELRPTCTEPGRKTGGWAIHLYIMLLIALRPSRCSPIRYAVRIRFLFSIFYFLFSISSIRGFIASCA